MKSILLFILGFLAFKTHAQGDSFECLLNKAICLENGDYKLESNDCNYTLFKGTPRYTKSFIFSNPNEIFTLEIKTIEQGYVDVDFAIYNISNQNNSDYIRLNLMGKDVGSATKTKLPSIQGLSTQSDLTFIDSGTGKSSYLKAIDKSDNLFLLIIFSKTDQCTFNLSHNNSSPKKVHSTMVELKELNNEFYFSNNHYDLIATKNTEVKYPFSKEFVLSNNLYEIKDDKCSIFLKWELESEEYNVLNINPNPAKNNIEVKFYNDELNRNLEIYNELGQLVKSIKNIESNFNSNTSVKAIDVSSYAAGKYFVHIFRNGQTKPVLTSSFIIVN